MRSTSRILGAVAVAVCAVLTACGGGGSTHSSTPSTPSTPSSTVTLQSITVSPSAPSLTLGQSQQMLATALYSDGSNKDVTMSATWSSSDAAVASVNNAGMVQAKAQGSATITATMRGVHGSAKLAANSSAATMTGLTISPASAAVGVGATLNFSAHSTMSDVSSQDITQSVGWSSSDSTVASVDNNGVMTAIKTGSTTITATSGSFTAASVVTVTPATLQSLSVLPGTGSVAAGELQQFSAYGIYSDNSQQDLTNLVSWDSSDASVATVQAGLAQSLKSGSSTISASFDGKNASATLQVTSATLSSITISPYLPTFAAGGFQQFTATGTFTDGSSQDLTSGVLWGSDNSAVAIIGNSGLATGVAAGTANISACVGSVCDNTLVTIAPANIVSIAVVPGTASIAAGTTQQLTATATFSDGSTQDITSGATWSSSAPGSAAVNSTGLVTASAVASNVTITASAGSVSGSATLDVTAATLTALSITPAVQTVGLNATVQFTATGIFSDGSSEDLTNLVAWTSSNASVATLSNTGLATTLGVGSAQITATFAGVNASTTLNVILADLVSITINHSAVSASAPVNAPFLMGKHTREQFYAWGNYSDGSSHLLANVAWSSNKVSFASASSNGVVRSKQKSGSVTIKAAYAGVSGTLAVNVTNASLSSLSITPASASIAPGTQQQYVLTGTYSDGTMQDLTLQGYWQTSSYSVATVSKGVATGVSAGTVTVKAWFQGITAPNVALTVTNASVQSLSVTPANPAVQLGLTQQFTATASFSDGTQQDVTSVVQWTSSNPAVAIVSKTGLAISASQGMANIGATFKSASNSTVLTVN